MLWVAISCCCSPSAPRNPSAWAPKPTIATIASSTSAPAALAATRARSRQAGGARTTNGSTSPAEAFTPIPTTSAVAAAGRLGPPRARALASVRGLALADGATLAGGATLAATPASAPAPAVALARVAPAASARAPAKASSTSVSLCAPPTANSSNTGFRPTNADATFAERPILCAACAVSAVAPRLAVTATAFSVHRPTASPSGATA